jgi:LysW-gamma-L-lysine carboxypeptidase
MMTETDATPTGTGDPDEIGLLRNLLEIPSPSGSEAAAVDHLVGWLAAHGFRAYRDAVGNGVGILGQEDDTTREVLLLGHIDTVRGFPPVTVRDGKLYGRGAVDAKGPLAAFAVAAARVGARPGWRMVVVGAVEEEAATSKGARQVARDRKPDLAIIGEPTGWQRVALGYKGRLLADVTVRRPMSHRAGPAPSAAEVAVSFWNSVQSRITEVNAGRDRAWDQVLANLRGFSCADDGLFETAQLTLGFRLPLDYGPERLKALLLEMRDGTHLDFCGEESAYRSGKNNALVRAFLAAVRAKGGEPGFVVKTGTSDMNVVGPVWACPIVAYGPGDSSLDHTPEEHLALPEWEHGVAVLAEALRHLTESHAGI